MTISAQQDTMPRGLVWAFASVSSMAIHTALAAAILTAAHFAKPAPPETQISIATLDSVVLAASSPPNAATAASAPSSATAIQPQSAEPERIAATETSKAVSGGGEPDRIQAARTVETATPGANTETARIAPAADIARPAKQTEVATASRPEPMDKPPVAETAAPVERPAPAPAKEAKTAATATAIEPSAPAPVERAETAVPVQPSPPAPSAARAEPATAVQPSTQTVAPGVERLAPAPVPQAALPLIRAEPQPTPDPALAPVRVAPAAVSELGESVAGLAAAPARPAPAEAREARIARFLRAYEGGRCFLAVPAGDETDPHLQVFSDRRAALSDFKSRSAGVVDVDAEAAPVGEAQCLALNFARRLPRYPDFGLRIELDSADVVSGRSLTGRLVNPAGRSVYLLTVDDDGMVVKANRSLKPAESGSQPFAIQMFLTDTPKTPTQLLIAVSADRPIDALEHLKGAPATDLFGTLRTDDKTMDFAIAAFEVR